MFPFFRFCIASLALTLLTGCGGGQTAVTATPATGLSGGSVITGVVATGSPLLGATIRMIDATGKTVGFVDAAGNATNSGTTSLTDGSYRLTMGVTAATLPLVIEVYGRNIAGTPVIMHSMLTSNTPPTVANVTPATEAVLALLVGANPASLFSRAGNNPGIALLSNPTAVSAAIDLINMVFSSYPGVTGAPFDFFGDSKFAADKTKLDAALEGLRIQVGQDANGNDQLQFSNKLKDASTIDAGIDLALAKTNLTSGNTPAIVVYNNFKQLVDLTTLAEMDKLSTEVNKIIARKGSSADFSTLVDPNYANNYYGTYLDFRNGLSYISNTYQLSRFQVTGCAGVTCNSLLVSALITNNIGMVVGYLSDAVSYDTGKWLFKGNGLLSDFHLYPAAYITYGLDENPTTAPPVTGVFVSINTVPATDAFSSIDTDTVRVITTPSQRVFRFTDCRRTYKCLSTAQPLTGGVSDTLLIPSMLGSADIESGAKYQLNLVLDPADPNYNRKDYYYLSGELPSISSNSFPKLDTIYATNPLRTTDITNGGRVVSWQTWAAANPNMTIILVRTVISAPAVVPVLLPIITDAILPVIDPGKIALPAPSVKSPINATSFQIWLGAQDNMGRRYYSNYTNIK